MALNWVQPNRFPGARMGADENSLHVRLMRENNRLAEENEQLRSRCEELTASAELWIRLYESALARAREDTHEPARDREPHGPKPGAQRQDTDG